MEINNMDGKVDIPTYLKVPEDFDSMTQFRLPLEKDNQIIIPDVGPTILLDSVNESLFGNKEIDFPKIELLRNGFTLRFNEKIYFVNSEINRYIKYLSENKNFEISKITKICPVNYNILNGTFLKADNVYHPIFKKLFEFRNYLYSIYESKDTLKRNIGKELIRLYWPNFFKGIVTSFIENPLMMVLRFKRACGKSLILNIINLDDRIVLLSENIVNNVLEMNTNERNVLTDEDIYKSIVEDWDQIIKMDNEKEFIINNLSTVIGSLDFATYIFESHCKENEYLIKVSDVNMIINFSSNKNKKDYIDYFSLTYPNLYRKSLEDQKDLLLNFEGFNKYLLNISTTYLKSFNDKEMINEMYYRITKELVNSYQKLYRFAKNL